MSGLSPRTRPVLLLSCVLLAALAHVPAPAGADADVPADWTIATTSRGILDAAWRDGRVFGVAELGGLLVHDPATGSLTPLTTVDGLGSNRTRCIEISPDGELWVGTADAGITRIFADLSMRFLTALPGQLDVRTLAFAGANAYYGGPNGGGRLVNGLPERSFRTEDGLVDEDVRAVAARGAKAWFGTGAGVSEFDIQANGLTTRNLGLGDLDVRAMVVAGGVVYCGTSTGLYQLDESDPGSVQWVRTTPALDVAIVDLASRGDRLVVLGTDRRVWTRTDPSQSWAFQQGGLPEHRLFAATIDEDDVIRLGGQRVDAAPIGTDRTPLFVDLQGNASPLYRQLHGDQFYGLGTDREGGAWVGAFPIEAGVSHWNADGRVVAYIDQESGDDVAGFNNDGWLTNLKIDVLETRSGQVWVSAFQRGLTRMIPAANDDPSGASYLHVTPNNSPLNMNRVYSISEDPHGNLWFCAAGEVVEGDFNAGIDVLLDPDDPYDPVNWVHIRANNSLLGGDGLFEITFEGDRVVWLVVRGVGLQRFVYGDGNGFDPASLTSASAWRTIRALPESSQDNLGGARQLAIGTNGRYWVATKGQGVFSFTYTTAAISGARQYRADSFGSRLLSDDAVSIAVDGYGDTWVATETGFNRIREGGSSPGVAAFTDLQNFLDYELGGDYSAQILRPLPGGVPVSLELSPAGPWLYSVSARGLSRVDLVPRQAPEEEGDGPTFAVYPNPVRTGDEEVIIAGFEGEVVVEIYDVQGRRIRRTTVSAGQRVWGVETVSGEPAANGLYLVRVTRNGETSTRVLAVER